MIDRFRHTWDENKEPVIRNRLKVQRAELGCHRWNNIFRSANEDGYQGTGRVISPEKRGRDMSV